VRLAEERGCAVVAEGATVSAGAPRRAQRHGTGRARAGRASQAQARGGGAGSRSGGGGQEGVGEERGGAGDPGLAGRPLEEPVGPLLERQAGERSPEVDHPGEGGRHPGRVELGFGGGAVDAENPMVVGGS
jgi:hypothetical protein